MTGFYLEKVGCFFFLMADHACHIPRPPPRPPNPRHPTRELRELPFENHDGDARRLA